MSEISQHTGNNHLFVTVLFLSTLVGVISKVSQYPGENYLRAIFLKILCISYNRFSLDSLARNTLKVLVSGRVTEQPCAILLKNC